MQFLKMLEKLDTEVRHRRKAELGGKKFTLVESDNSQKN